RRCDGAHRDHGPERAHLSLADRRSAGVWFRLLRQAHRREQAVLRGSLQAGVHRDRGGWRVKFGSVCSGIEAASMAWSVLGWEAAFFSEIEPFPCAALAHHYPHVPNHGDMAKFQEWPDHAIELLVGGTPCQSFSVA